MTSPAPVGLIRPESVATSEIFAPTVTEAVALVTSPGLAFLTSVFSPVVEAFAVGFVVVGVAGEVGDPVVGAGARGGGVEFFGGVVAVWR